MGIEPRQPVSWAPALVHAVLQPSSLSVLSGALSGYQRALPPAEVLGLPTPNFLAALLGLQEASTTSCREHP